MDELDATFVKARQDGRVGSLAVIVAVGVTAGGRAPRPMEGLHGTTRLLRDRGSGACGGVASEYLGVVDLWQPGPRAAGATGLRGVRVLLRPRTPRSPR